MIILKIISKLIFLPFYLLLMITSILVYMIGLAVNNQASFREILTDFGIDEYWEF